MMIQMIYFAYRKYRRPLNSQCVEKVTIVPKRTHDLSPDIHDRNTHNLFIQQLYETFVARLSISFPYSFWICLLFLLLFSYTTVVLHC